MYGCGKVCPILTPFRLPQISCFTLSLKCFSSDSDNCPDVGIGPCFSSATRRRQGQPYWHSCFPPRSFVLPSFVWFYIFFLLVRYSCPLSAGVLHALLCLKVSSWCIHGERRTPHPSTPPPFCSSPFSFYKARKITQPIYLLFCPLW